MSGGNGLIYRDGYRRLCYETAITTLEAMMTTPQPETLHLDSDDATGYPNSPLPVLVYRGVVNTPDLAARADAFKRHGWSSS